ncbi:hypothetical protein [Aurantimicrobium minutum]|uniref:hypothetical protein n=1 Tax=Aurantimicrobium minutum TaxID=708131 RepID=UPI0024747BD8|nr:hypothetical protein [Aurantimicrobium minutum]MDH6423754.1 hypothetical protein [Aurantimicrobium minutum]
MTELDVKEFDPLFYRPCIFPIMGELGYGTSVSVNNGLVKGPFASEMDITFTFLSEEGKVLGSKYMGTLEPGHVVKHDTRDVLDSMGIEREKRMLGVAHVVPVRFRGKTSVDVSRAELMAHVSASDDFIEFRQEPKGVITGLAYQMGPQNDSRFNKTRTTLLQAPKVIVSESVDTIFALLNVSTTFDYHDTGNMEYSIVDASGNSYGLGTISVKPWTMTFLSVREALIKLGKLEQFISAGGLGMIIGLSRDSGMVPISMTRNLDTGAIACDHTLPPIYYFTTWGGQRRIEANESLHKLLFAESNLLEGANS